MIQMLTCVSNTILAIMTNRAEFSCFNGSTNMRALYFDLCSSTCGGVCVCAQTATLL